MKKYILIFSVLILASSSFSQSKTQEQQQQAIRKEIDSLKKVLPAMNGVKKVDWLNKLAYDYFALWINWKLEADSAYPFAMQAYNEAKKIGYKKGLGYAYIRLGEAQSAWFGFDIQVNKKYDTSLLETLDQYAKKAIAIGQQINDNAILGAAYWLLAWGAYDGTNYSGQPNYSKYVLLLEKAVSYYHKVGKQDEYQGFYRDMNMFPCDNCTGVESAIEKIYSDCAVWGDRNDVAKLESYMNKAIEYSFKANDKRRAAVNYEKLAQVKTLKQASANEESEADLKKEISIYREIGDEEGEMGAINTLCGVYFNTGDFEKGLDYGKRSMFLFNRRKGKVSDEFDWGVLWMSHFYNYAGDYETALKLLYLLNPNYSDQLPRELRNGNLGEVHRLMGNHDSAMYYLAPFESNNIFFSPAKAFLGSLYIDLKQYEKGLQLIKAAIEIDKKKGLVGPVARDNNAAAKAYYLKGEFNSALNYAREGLAYLKAINMKVYMVDNYKLHADIFNKLGKNDSAYYYLTLYTTLKDSLLSRQFLWRLNTLRQEAEEERKTSQINLLNKNNQLKEQKLKQQATVRNSLIAGIILLFLLGVFVFRSFYLKRKKQQAENEKRQTELEMQALRAQMNPHFIFNCLSSINKYILKNEPDTASDYLTRFSRLIRMVLLNSQRSLITLEDELEMLTIYLDMERMRFKNTFNYNIIFSNRVDTGAIFIPPLLLQPFCENAIWHGLKHLPDRQASLADPQSGRQELGKLDIVLSMEDKILNCTITDNGIGRQKAAEIKSKSAEEKKSMGLKITTERLILLNQDKGLNTSYEIVDLKDENGNATGTKVNLKISYKETIEELV